MAYMAKDGQNSTNRAPMLRHNRSLEGMEKKSEAGGVDPTAQPAQPEDGEESPEMVAEQHGPAVETHTMHDHEGGQHQVMSMHPDGHQHHSMHGSAEEAHEHAKKLSGAHHESEMGNQNEGETEPEYE